MLLTELAALCLSLHIKYFLQALRQMDTQDESKCLKKTLPAFINGTDDRNQHNPLPCD